MHCDLHALGTSHLQVSGDRVEPDEWTNNRPEPQPRHWRAFHNKRSCDQCMCSAVTSHMTSQHTLKT